MSTLPFDYIPIWPTDDEGAGYRRRFVIEGKGLVKTQLADAVPTGQSMLQLQVSSSCARRSQTIARPSVSRPVIPCFPFCTVSQLRVRPEIKHDIARIQRCPAPCRSASKQMRR